MPRQEKYRGADLVSELIDFVISHKGGALYHVTDERNFPAIRQHGLLSKAQVAKEGISVAYPGGSELTWTLDEDYGLWDYVFLGFNKSAVMPAHKDEVRFRRPRILHIDPSILHWRGVKIALGRANHRNTKVYTVPWAVHYMDHDVFAGRYDPDDIFIRWRVARVFDYEILVPARVPPEFIIGWEEP